MKQKIKVALVDDHSLFRQGLQTLIESGTEMEVCLEASNGKELFERLDQHALPEVILLDLEMPEMDGMTTCEKLRKSYPDLKILILTMHQDARVIQFMLKQGANGYVLKTAKWSELQNAIKQVLKNDYYFSDLVGMAMLQNLKNPKQRVPLVGQAISLTKREREVLELIIRGASTADIAEALYISRRTVDGHRYNLLKRLEVNNTAGLIVKALKLGVISLEDF